MALHQLRSRTTSSIPLYRARSLLWRANTAAAAFAAAVLMVPLSASPALGQNAGEPLVVAVEADAGITIDGALDDWSDITAVVTETGPDPSADPATNGSLRWQVVAQDTTIFFAATITDEAIVAGEHGEAYWNEDSIEFYVNFSGDLAATDYIPGVAQVRISPVDIGGTDATALTLTGNGVEQVEVEGFVFATDTGWGTEIAVDVSEIAQPGDGDVFGFQVHANGSSAGDRDLKLIWSENDVNDTSFEDPSVFGQAVFTSADGDVTETVDEDPADPVDATEPAAELAVDEVESIVEADPEVITTEDQQRSLLYAAIASSIAVLLGGILFERKRKNDEARLSEGSPLATEPVPPQLDDDTTVTDADVPEADEEFQAMLDSILDDGPET